jgi:hypothetical protein
MAGCDVREDLAQCAPLRRVQNLSDVPIRIDGWYEQVSQWAPLVPRVEPGAEYQPFAAALWLPKATVLRSVNLRNNQTLQVFGPVGEGATVVQQADALAAAD